jgi:hypothetical protein
MQVLEVRAVTPADEFASLAFLRRRLDADHIGAPVAQRANAGRTGARQRQVDDLET